MRKWKNSASAGIRRIRNGITHSDLDLRLSLTLIRTYYCSGYPKDTPANEPLFSQLATLAAQSLHRIRSLKLLNADFLAVLPNPQDTIPSRYQLIRSAIVQEMNEKPLTPTHSKAHAAAKHLLQAKASLKDLLSQKDLESLLGTNGGPLQWAIGATQKNGNIDRFLSGLAIKAWDVDKFVEQLELRFSERQRFIVSASRTINEPDPQFMRWLAAKPFVWHQQFYLMLHKEFTGDAAIRRLSFLKIVRLADGNYSVGSKCYFPDGGVEHDSLFPRVAKEVFYFGNNIAEGTRSLLSALGVREVGEPEQVHAILKQRYAAAPIHQQPEDVKRFIKLVELDREHSTLFSEYFVVKSADGRWRKPSQCYLDSPVVDTGLAAFYESPATAEKRFVIDPSYSDLGIRQETLRRFLDAIGVRTRLEVAQTTCPGNPEWRHLSSVPGERHMNPIDRDYHIPSLYKVLDKPTMALSKLIWKTMCDLPRQPNTLEARYQKNTARGCHAANSQLVHDLRDRAWVPQSDGRFVRPAEAEMSLLPNGFPFDAGAEWIKSVQFGVENQQRAKRSKEREAEIKGLGFADLESLERARRFAAFPRAEQDRVLAEFQNRRYLDLPEHEPRNPERRAEQIGKQAAIAPGRGTEQRERSVSVGREKVKQRAAEYLRAQYTTAAGEMICQICERKLPFTLADGSYYCEKVEFLKDLKRWHDQNYLSLCPNHGAMFREANGSRDELKARFAEMQGPRLAVVLARTELTIYFTGVHIADLAAVQQLVHNLFGMQGVVPAAESVVT